MVELARCQARGVPKREQARLAGPPGRPAGRRSGGVGRLARDHRPARSVKADPSGQRAEARLDIGGDQVADLAVDRVEPRHRVEQAAAFLVQRAMGLALDRLAQFELAVARRQDAVEIEGGKGLPLVLEQGKHLPQAVAQGRVFGRHFAFLGRKPAAIIASAVLRGSSW
ncbi:MAG: hypothetical protein VX569_01750 [Pseudomonadota bacterium]|nr:hypothetical protein [Pseudomonadota bacterium]